MNISRLKSLSSRRYADAVKSVLRDKGHAFFDRGTFNLNLVGVRGPAGATNRFDDLLSVIYKEDEGKKEPFLADRFACTTDPGTPWLKRPINPKGCAILVPGQYRSTYKIDLHGGRYPALCQRGGPVRVYRDNDRDEEYDLDPATIDTGWFGINIHRANEWSITQLINRFSAGCQVVPDPKDLERLLALARMARARYGEWLTYTLLEASDF